MLFLTPPKTADDIRAFCQRFDEGLRVEYKGTFDASVKDKLPKVISSFANSLGGVLVIGVPAVNGVPQDPIEGFPTLKEEVSLTVENICLSNIHPAVIPNITIVPSDVAGKQFAVIEVEESVEAPHAIENSAKVYVRTGNASNPYELSNVDTIIELLRRRENPEAMRKRLIEKLHPTSESYIHNSDPQVRVTIVPLLPRRPLCTSDECWNFLMAKTGEEPFPSHRLVRVENGALAIANGQAGEVNRYGLVSVVGKLHETPTAFQNVTVINFHRVLLPYSYAYKCATSFFETVGFRGRVLVEVQFKNLLNRRVVFVEIPSYGFDTFKSYDDSLCAAQILSAENLKAAQPTISEELFTHLCFSFWQTGDAFPAGLFHQSMSAWLKGLGL